MKNYDEYRYRYLLPDTRAHGQEMYKIGKRHGLKIGIVIVIIAECLITLIYLATNL